MHKRYNKIDLGLSLGSAWSYLYVKKRGIIYSCPTILKQCKYLSKSGNYLKEKIIFPDEEYKFEKGEIEEIKPIESGSVAHEYFTELLVSYFFHKTFGPLRLLRPKILVSFSPSLTSIQKRALISLSMRVGARKVETIEEPVAACIGANLDITKPKGTLVVHLGAGISEVSIISLGNIVISQKLNFSGNEIDNLILAYVEKNYGVKISLKVAEEIKIHLAICYPQDKEEVMIVKGKDISNGLTEHLRLTSSEIRGVISQQLIFLLKGVNTIFAKTSPELIADIMDNGIYLTGGLSKLKGLERLFSTVLNIKAIRVEDPSLCVIKGMGKIVEGNL